jgi:hypothetical protein
LRNKREPQEERFQEERTQEERTQEERPQEERLQQERFKEKFKEKRPEFGKRVQAKEKFIFAPVSIQLLQV